MRADEALRTRAFLSMSSGLAAAGGVTAFLVDGNLMWRWVFVILVIALLFANGIVLKQVRGAPKVRPGTVFTVVGLNAATSFAAMVYYGLYSPAPMVMMLTVSYFGLSEFRRAAMASYVAISLASLVAMFAVGFEWVADPGMVHATDLTPQGRVVFAVLVQAVYLSCMVFAAGTRRATSQAVVGLEDALHRVALKEAQLAEAREQLQVVVGAGTSGRLTGTLMGPWRLSEVIGRGGMGEVYLGRQPNGAQAAVKVLHPAVAEDPRHFALFAREARNTAKLDTPHVVGVYDAGIDPEPYLATELLEGEDLRRILGRRTLSTSEVQEMTNHAAAALDAAAAEGIVHRDIKPSNIFRVRGEGESSTWKLLDFGVSKALGADVTLGEGILIGTPAFMAPEAVDGGRVSPRSDVFSLAAVVYRALTGQRPFVGANPRAIVREVQDQQPPRPSSLVTLPADVDLVLALGLAKDADSRPASAGAFATALALALRGRLSARLRRRASALVSTRPWGAERRSIVHSIASFDTGASTVIKTGH